MSEGRVDWTGVLIPAGLRAARVLRGSPFIYASTFFDFGAEIKSSAQHRETDMIKNTQRAQREQQLAQDPNIPMEEVRVYFVFHVTLVYL